MCGIAGIYGFRDDSLINKFSEQLYHRGPDGEGYYIDERVSLLNRRLAIIDRKGGDQPIFNEDKTIVVTYNGEIYNYRELRQELVNLGHKFRTKSDTEVIVHGYEQWGDLCFDRFNGMFGVALYDKKQNKLILARDHFGIKPLYYSIINSKLKTQNYENLKLVFCSEIKPIIHSGLIDKKPNDRILYRYLRYRIHDDGQETFFDGIYKLLPGEMVIVQNSKFKIQSYTNLKNELLNLSNPQGLQDRNLSEEQVAEFKKRLIEAIRLRLISEVSVGTCLSGGLDSSTIVTIVNKLLKDRVKEAESVGKIQNTFSAVFPGGSNDEGRYIEELISKISPLRSSSSVGQANLKSHKVYPKPEEFFKEMEDFIRTQEEPTISTGPYAQYKVMQEAHKYVTVLLDGQGADEMMAGYLPYYKVYLKQLWKEQKLNLVLKEFIQSLGLVSNVSINQLIGTFLGKKKIDVSNLLNSQFANKFRGVEFKVINDNLKKRLLSDIFRDSLQALLRYEDKNAMRFSIEGRVPFLDFNLLRYLFSLADEAIIKNGWNKYVLRESVADLLPKEIVRRRNKIGFTTPEYEWFMRMKNKIYSIFLSDSFAKRKYFNQPEVIKAFQKFIEGKNDDTMLFWRLLNVEIWLRVFFDIENSHPQGVFTISSHPEGEKRLLTNEGKKLNIRIAGKEYLRYPIRTELFKKGDNVNKKISDSVIKFLSTFSHSERSEESRLKTVNSASLDSSVASLPRNDKWGGWFIVISEKIIAITQGRSYFIWDIKTGFWANLLSKFVKKTPYGIGLGSPWTMQLAINEIGLPRTILAAVVGKMVQPFGVRGMFYRIAGNDVASIDGPTEYSLYPSNVSAKLGPKNPQGVAEQIHTVINSKFETRNPCLAGRQAKQIQNSKLKIQNFLGIIIIDANDLGQKVLGNSTTLPNSLIEKIFADNPMGQADEQTPLVLVLS